MYIAHAAIAFRHHVPPQIIKNMDLETVSHFDSRNHRKSQNYAQSESQGLPKSTLKSIKLHLWASVCPLGVPLDPRITKMVSQDPKWSLKVSKMTDLGVKSHPFH